VSIQILLDVKIVNSLMKYVNSNSAKWIRRDITKEKLYFW